VRLFFLRRSWNALARRDPFWAVLTDPEKRGRQWQPEEFFATGVETIKRELDSVRSRYPELRMGQALDFGCGVGRLTQALAGHFERVVGVDIAEDMLALARTHNRHGDRVEYLHNHRSDLRLLASDRFDFVCSIITLQHMEPALSRAYIAEFVRVCAPGGVVVFQIPAHQPEENILRLERLTSSWWPPTFFRRLWRISLQQLPFWVQSIRLQPVMEMHGIPEAEVVALLETSGARLLGVNRHDAASETVRSYDYLAVKKPAARN